MCSRRQTVRSTLSWRFTRTPTWRRKKSMEVHCRRFTASINTPSCVVSSTNCGKLVLDSEFKLFTHYEHLEVSKLDRSVVNVLMFKGHV